MGDSEGIYEYKRIAAQYASMKRAKCKDLRKRSPGILAIVRHAKDLKQILRCNFARLESAVNTAVTHLSAMLTCKLKSRATMFLQRIHQDAGLVTALLNGVGTEARERVLSPMCCLDVDELWKFLIWLCTEDFE